VVREAAGAKKQRDQLRTAMCDQGCTREQIAVEMGRRFGFRPRQAWRHTLGWTQEQAAVAYNHLLDHDQAPMSGKRISDFETWPHGGVKPTPTTLAMLAIIYATTPAALIDLDDREALSPQELITLNIHTPPPGPSGSPPNNTTTAHATRGEHAAPPELDTATGQSERELQSTTHRLTAETTPASHRHHWRLVVAWLMAITTALGGAVMMTRASVAGSHPTIAMPLHPLGPSATGSVLPTAPNAPPQQQRAMSTAPPPPLHPLVQTIPPPAVSRPAPITPHTPPPSLGSPPAPLSSPPSTADSASATAGAVLKNMYSGLCLDDQEDTTTDDRSVLGLRGCDNSANQRWRGRLIDVQPPFVALNLVSSKSGRCVTYQPGSVSVWLAPCGDHNQTWLAARNGQTDYFQPVAIPAACLSATSQTEAIQLRPCATSSPMRDWQPQHPAQTPTS